MLGVSLASHERSLHRLAVALYPFFRHLPHFLTYEDVLGQASSSIQHAPVLLSLQSSFYSRIEHRTNPRLIDPTRRAAFAEDIMIEIFFLLVAHLPALQPRIRR